MEKYVPAGFVLAGLANIAGVLGPSMAFTNPHIAPLDPAVMSNFGLVMIILWGLAYIATAGHWRAMRWLVGIFCIEKICYGANWLLWINAHGTELGEIYERDFMTGLFFSVYGPNDMLFAVFFAYAFLKASRSMT
jgi:hypothetical protein